MCLSYGSVSKHQLEKHCEFRKKGNKEGTNLWTRGLEIYDNWFEFDVNCQRSVGSL